MLKSIKDYFVGAVRELNKVTWLTQKQIVSHTIIVLVVTLGVAAFMTLFDYGFSELYEYMLNNI